MVPNISVLVTQFMSKLNLQDSLIYEIYQQFNKYYKMSMHSVTQLTHDSNTLHELM